MLETDASDSGTQFLGLLKCRPDTGCFHTLAVVTFRRAGTHRRSVLFSAWSWVGNLKTEMEDHAGDLRQVEVPGVRSSERPQSVDGLLT